MTQASSHPDAAGRADPRAGPDAGLYDLFRVGSTMFEHPTTHETLRLARASAKAIAGCTVLAVYIAAGGRMIRYSGKANHRLDVLVQARGGRNGALETGNRWRYALFFWGTGEVKGAFVLQSASEPPSDQMFLLHALAEPTGAALATAELIERERHQARELERLNKEQAVSNQEMAATIVRLNTHQRVRDALVDAAGRGNGEAEIVGALSTIIQRSVVLQDSFGNERAFGGIGDSGAPPGALVPGTDSATGTTLSSRWWTTRIRSRGETLGIVGIYDPENNRNDDDRFAVEYASAMIAVELAHRRNVAEVEIRLGRDLADDLVAGVAVADALDRAEALRFDLRIPLRVLLVAWESPTPNGVDIGAAMRHELAELRVPALISRRPDATLAVIADGHDLSSLYSRLCGAVSSTRGTIGVGERCTVEDLSRSFSEANRALRIRLDSRRPYGLSNHDELGLLRILDTSGSGVELQLFVNTWIGALVDHDRAHRSELVRTLGVYLDSGGNYDRAADALIIHRSTLRYRLGRIRELTGRDLTDPDSRLNLHIALRVWSVLRDNLS